MAGPEARPEARTLVVTNSLTRSVAVAVAAIPAIFGWPGIPHRAVAAALTPVVVVQRVLGLTGRLPAVRAVAVTTAAFRVERVAPVVRTPILSLIPFLAVLALQWVRPSMCHAALAAQVVAARAVITTIWDGLFLATPGAAAPEVLDTW